PAPQAAAPADATTAVAAPAAG
ncbi:MAG: hypothetical protein JWQ20_3134, partial [Conexibacter sp.]|nr:hypothetical protein [Conexibacter sp.]